MRVKKFFPAMLAACVASGFHGTTMAQIQDAVTPAVPQNSPLIKEPQTTEEYFDAALLVVQLARPDLARYYLQQANALNPDADTLMKLRDKYGISSFLSLSQVPELEQPANELLDRVIQAARERSTDPAYVDGLVQGLFASGRTREQAVLELKQLGPYAVNPILKQLINPLPKDEGRLVYTLTILGEPIRPALIGALTSSNKEVRSAAAKALGWVGSDHDAIYLWHPALAGGEAVTVKDAARRGLAKLLYDDENRPDRVATFGAVRQLLSAAQEHLGDRYNWGEDADDQGMVNLWTWDDTAGELKEHRVEKRIASVFMAERLARQAADLAPENEQAGTLLLAALFANDIENGGWENSIPKGTNSAFSQALAAGPEICQQVLELAMKEDNVAAALGSAEALGMNGSSRLLTTSMTRLSTIQKALDASDPRVQHAAAIAILNWEPTRPFANSGRVVEILARAIDGDTRPNGVVIDPNLNRATVTAGIFSELGFDTVIASTGQQGFVEAASHGDMEIAVLDLNTIRWELTDTVANLRADARTAHLPIIVYGPGELRPRARHVVSNYSRVAYVDVGSNSAEVARQLFPVLKSFSPPPLTQTQRAGQIREAAYWLKRIAEGPSAALFDLTLAESALSSTIGHLNDEVSKDAVAALAGIGRPSVQSRLLEVAIAPEFSVDLKRSASTKLVSHIRRHGRLLNDDEVSGLKAAVDAEQDPILKTSLATIVGSLNPKMGGVIKELLKAPGPVTPPGVTADEPAMP